MKAVVATFNHFKFREGSFEALLATPGYWGGVAWAGGGVTTLDVSCVWWRGAAYCAGLLGARVM